MVWVLNDDAPPGHAPGLANGLRVERCLVPEDEQGANRRLRPESRSGKNGSK